MAEREAKPLAYISETVLKKRKSTESLALTRKAQLELGKYGQNNNKKKKVEDIKRPEEFIKQFRAQELDLIRMKQRGKGAKSALVKPKSKLLFIIRIQGQNDMHPKTRKILYKLRLTKIFSGVFAMSSEGILQQLQKVEPYVTYGYPNLTNVKELIYKKGYAKIEKQRIPLTDNNIIEQTLGKYGMICIEDLIHEIANVGPHFKEVIKFLGPFLLSKPEGGLLGKKQRFKDGGESGNREDQINDLISKMN
ncbi:60S ribosomal protein L7-1-like [Mangifera indica]|uniref:60S ribosomal protein L7-1-like n=1 Tax=Mangifera indica TaxID=29780 RepID=UPI001CFBBD13|nr:60S ribosomal protein L7-1-like [Mangifera indica]